MNQFILHVQTSQESTIMADELIEIDRKDLMKLKNLYISDESKNYTAFTTIDNYIRWFEQNPNVKHIKFFCLNGDFSDGTFVMTVSDAETKFKVLFQS